MGDLVIPHHIGGSIIVKTTVVRENILPMGTHATLGHPAINAMYLGPTALVKVAPSLVSRAILKTKPALLSVMFDYIVCDKNDAWHDACCDGVVDIRSGKHAFVRFINGRASLIP